jgi:chromosome segregation ATPase
MNNDVLKNILIVVLVGMTIFAAFQYGSSLKEKNDLAYTLSQIQGQVAILEKDKEDLSVELKKKKELEGELRAKLSEFKGYLKASKKRLTKLFADYGEAQKANEQLGSKFFYLKIRK